MSVVDAKGVPLLIIQDSLVRSAFSEAFVSSSSSSVSTSLKELWLARLSERVLCHFRDDIDALERANKLILADAVLGPKQAGMGRPFCWEKLSDDGSQLKLYADPTSLVASSEPAHLPTADDEDALRLANFQSVLDGDCDDSRAHPLSTEDECARLLQSYFDKGDPLVRTHLKHAGGGTFLFPHFTVYADDDKTTFRIHEVALNVRIYCLSPYAWGALGGGGRMDETVRERQ